MNRREDGTRIGSSREPSTLSFFSRTRLSSALRCAWASRSGVSVMALFDGSVTHVVPPRRWRAACTHGTWFSASNSPVSIRAVNSRTSDVSTSPTLNVSVWVLMCWAIAVGTVFP